ncbi:MAG: ATP-binding protein, partial [Candidatus Omnitrophica bacterium]|nr:ATP-binding protein [Candidatus Omnitrophota bacterium]
SIFSVIREDYKNIALIVNQILSSTEIAIDENKIIKAEINKFLRQIQELSKEQLSEEAYSKIKFYFLEKYYEVIISTELKELVLHLFKNSFEAGANNIEIELLKKDNKVIIAVRDDGKGIPAEYRRYLFEALFFSTKPRLHSLTLWRTKKILNNIMADIKLSREPGRRDEGKQFSTEFLIELPLIQEDALLSQNIHDLKNKLESMGGFANRIKAKFRKEVPEKMQEIINNCRNNIGILSKVSWDYLRGIIETEQILKFVDQLNEPFRDCLKSLKISFSQQEFSERLKNSLLAMISAGDAAVKIINESISWLGRSMSKCAIEEFIEGITDSLRKLYPGIKIQLHISDEAKRLGEVSTYSAMLKMGLEELVKNAAKYSESQWISITLELREHLLVIKVSDGGKGIPKEKQKLIMIHGYTESDFKRRGTGYGLPTLKDAVESVGGEFDLIESSLGKGSTFEFSLPLKDIPRPVLGKFIKVIISGLMGSKRRELAYWLAGYFGLRYINGGFLVRVIIYYLLLEAGKLGIDLRAKDSVLKDAAVKYAEDFLNKERIDYSTEPIKIDGVDTQDEGEKYSTLRDEIKRSIDWNDENKNLFYKIGKFPEFQKVIKIFLKKLAEQIEREAKYNGVVIRTTDPREDAEDIINVRLEANAAFRSKEARRELSFFEFCDEFTGKKDIRYEDVKEIKTIESDRKSLKEVINEAVWYIDDRAKRAHPKKSRRLELPYQQRILLDWDKSSGSPIDMSEIESAKTENLKNMRKWAPFVAERTVVVAHIEMPFSDDLKSNLGWYYDSGDEIKTVA